MKLSTFVSCETSPLRVQLFSQDSYISFPEHMHNESSIVICTGGSLESIQDGRRQVLTEGHILITNREVAHSSRYAMDGSCTTGVTIDLNLSALDSLVRDYLGRRYARSSFRGSLYRPEVTSIAKQIENEHSRDIRGSRLMIDALAKQILVKVLRSWPSELMQPHEIVGSPRLPRHELVRAIELMNQMPSDELTIPKLARSCNRTPSGFSRLFTNSAGKTPYRLYNEILMDRASDFLYQTDRAIKDIALSLGFNSLSHFSSMFRAFRGMSPTDYRIVSRRPGEDHGEENAVPGQLVLEA
jgi:AraC family transcriptional regulator